MSTQFEEVLGIPFQDASLLRLALTHRSYVYETPGAALATNERMEFLGDSILALISADFLYRTFPTLTEGELTDVRAVLVRTETLATFARELAIGDHLRMGKGEQGTKESPRVLASAFEAVLGAIFLDQGVERVQQFLLPRLEPIATTIVEKRLFKDSKSLFQEVAQARESITPSYRLANQEGPSHNRTFTIEVMLGDTVAGRGQGRNKQTAEQEAARNALESKGWLL
ncbi:MAG: ribonuclease III [Ktedonobacteraceae bacterium]